MSVRSSRRRHAPRRPVFASLQSSAATSMIDSQPMAPKRLLVVISEPPPTSSGLGTAWAKLAMGAVNSRFAMDFMGPDPVRCSNHGDSGLPSPARLHGFRNPPLSRIASLGRNSARSPGRWAWTALRAPFALAERWMHRGLYNDWIRRETARRLPLLLASEPYDAVAVMATSLDLADTVRHACGEAQVPFVLAIGDPLGWRDEAGGFEPESPSLQQSLLRAAAAFVTTESAYHRYYARAFEIAPERMVFLQDSFIPVGAIPELEPSERVPPRALFHWGQVDPWRPMDTLVSGLAAWNLRHASDDGGPLGLAIMGAVIEPRMRELATAALGSRFTQIAPQPYLAARAVARTASLFVVIVGHRHRDNVPSKLIDSLAYGKPLLLLSHPESAAADLVHEHEVGVVADIRDAEAVLDGIECLVSGQDDFRASFSRESLARAWSFSAIGERFRNQLSNALGW